MNVDLLEEYPELPIGWHDLFECMCKELLDYIRVHRCPEVKIMAVKEKFGGMRVIVDMEGYSDDATDAIIEKWCDISKDVCCSCGEPNVKHTRDYIVPVCKKCWQVKLHRHPDFYHDQTSGPIGYLKQYPKEFELLREKRRKG